MFSALLQTNLSTSGSVDEIDHLLIAERNSGRFSFSSNIALTRRF